MYLLDSCTISDFMKGELNTSRKIKSISPSLISTTTITQMEITYGLLRKFDKNHHYFTILEDFLKSITVLPFNEAAAIESANIRTTLEKRGTPIGAYDILIAGMAKSEALIMVTANGKEFQRVEGLLVENWR